MFIKYKSIQFLLISFFITYSGFGQEYSKEFYEYQNKYPSASKVRLQNEVNLTLELKNDKIEIEQENIETDLYLNQSATYGSKRSIKFSSFFELSEIEASSFLFEKDDYQEFEVENFTQRDELENSFHDDFKSVNYIYPNLKKGSKSTLKYIEKIKDPRFLSAFYFGESCPIIKNKYTITVDNDINLALTEFNTEGFDIKFNKEVNRRNTIYTWELENVEAFSFEDNAPSYKEMIPHLVPRILSYKVNDNEIKILDKVNDLYNWYYSLTKDINQEAPSEELISIVNELTQNKNTELEKVKAIYYWVQQNIKYIAFEYKLGGFIPRDANKVFKNKYGDCKDNSSILKQMLDIAGIKGHLTWIGTRDIPYTYSELPTPMADNHMILSYINNNKVYYLDATGRYLPIDYPSSFIQGKEALIGYNANKFEIKKVPVIEPEKNLFQDTTYVKLKDKILQGKTNTRLTGYQKSTIFSYLEHAKTDDEIKEFYNRSLQKGSNKFLITNLENTNTFSYNKDFLINYDFTIADYAKHLGNEIYLNLNLNKFLSYIKPKNDRKTALEFDYKQKLEFTTYFEIPNGYEVNYIPENIQVDSELLRAEITYKQEKNTIQYQHAITLKFLKLDLEQQKEIINLIDKMEQAYNEIIVLQKKN